MKDFFTQLQGVLSRLKFSCISILFFFLISFVSHLSAQTVVTGERCFVSPTVPGTVWAKSTWSVNSAAGTVTIRTTFSKTFVDNTYGTSAIGWPGGHTFGNLTGSDKLGWSIKDANGVVKLAFEQDYISSGASFPSGYGTLGFGGDGNNPTVGLTTDVLSFNTSMDVNFNDYNYVLIDNSPATDANYTSNPSYPNWINDVWYEVTVKLSVFGAAGFGYPDIATVHASPSKTGNNTEVVNPASCNASLGDFVWNDQNGNGLQDAGEPGISGVTVTLTKPDGSTATATTNASGFYQFTNLSAGTYSVSFPTSLSGGYGITSPKIGADDTKDSDPLQGTGIASGIVLYPGQNNTTVDAGYVISNLSLGNKVFIDANRSGLLDAGDGFVSGAIVRLYNDVNNDNIADGSFIKATSTNALGEYTFTDLAPGNYIVGVVLPSGYSIMYINGDDPDNNTDNDNNAISLESGEARGKSISLASGTEPGGNINNTYDFAIYDPAQPPTGGAECFSGTNPIVWAKSYWTVNVNDQTVTIRTTFAKTFVDNTYGTNAIGWPGGHTFDNLVGSDNLTWSIRDANGVEKLKFQQDYISTDATRPSGYGTTGFNNDGNTPSVGLASDVLSFRTSMDVNFNTYGYVLTTNSPSTDANYTPNPSYPNWIYDVWYEVTVKKSVFGAAGFGFPLVASVHASPSKTGNNTEVVNQTTCTESEIGNFVWYDQNNNGLQDAGEPGIAGVLVTLTKPGGATVTTTTNANGMYYFTGLPAGTYTVTFATPSGYLPAQPNQGSNDATDSDPVSGSVTVTIINLEKNYTIDAGFITPLNLGNYVWNDQNNNGIQDANEPVISGATVNLYADANSDNIPDGAALQTTTTNASGVYSFTGIVPGNYIAGVIIPAGYAGAATTATSANPNNDDNTDNNGITTVNNEVRSNYITLSVAGEPTTDGDGNNGNLTLDFGLKGTGSIGDFVWNDLNGNGIQDAGEPGIAGVVVTLTYPNGSTTTTTTDANGAYSFNNLAPGTTYSVSFPTPAGFVAAPSNAGGDDTKDSDPINGVVTNVTVVAGTANTTIDAGFQSNQLVLGNYVWNDQNNNGIQDAGEPAINGASVKLYADANADNIADGAALLTTTTDINGIYTFSGLTPGNFIVAVTLPSGYTASSVSSSTPNDNINTDNNGSNTSVAGEVRSNFITLTTGGEPANAVDGDGTNGNLTLDFGLKGTGSIGDFVWNDLNGNGIQDAGEPGIAGVVVTLTYPNGSTTTTTTDANGAYSFNNLAPGTTYSVSFPTPAGFVASPSNAGGDDTKDSDPINGVVTNVTVVAGIANTTIDAGYQSNQLNLGNFVWNDVNNNGIQDAGEPGIIGVTVKLFADANLPENVPDGAALQTTTTNASGFYNFTGLTPGRYILGITAPAGYAQGFTTASSLLPDNNDNTDNNGITIIGIDITSNYITLTTGGEPTTDGDGNNGNLTLDFALRGTGSLGDFVWNDLNGNGIQDSGEPGISGATVTLTYPGGTTASTTTDANGAYSFINLAPGSYTVAFTTPSGFTASPSNIGADDKDSDPVNGTVSGIALTAGQTNITIDAGFQSNQLVLGNYVWNDQNNNGIQDAGEPAINGASVKLYADANADNTPDGAALQTTTTNASGNYTFTGLTPGNYIVAVVIPTGFAASSVSSTTPNNDNNTDNNGVTTVSGELRSNFITLSTGGEPSTDGDGTNGNLTLDFGLKGTGSIGDFVWNDLNGNGIQDAGEPGIAGVVVTLTYPNGSTTTTTTDANGAYSFNNLAPGTTYSVSFPTPAGFIAAPSNTGGDDTKDSDPINGVVTNVTVVAGIANTTIDAGFQSNQLVLGNYVWNDINNNGIQDVSEPGINGVSVKLFADANADNIPDGAAVQTTTTNVNGLYSFSGLTPGKYIVGITAPSGYAMGFTTLTSLLPDNNDNTDNNGITIIGIDITSNFITLTTAGEPTTDGDGNNGNLTLDFGLRGTGSIGDQVWVDANANGLQDVGEGGIPNVLVTLTHPNGSTSTTTTNANGEYLFNNLAPGTYSVNFTTPAGYNATISNAGADDTKDSDPVSGVVNGIVLAASQNNTTIDAGFYLPASLGDFVWNDLNGNGIQDANEPGIAGVTVTLSTGASTTTNANGAYSFNNLAPGIYNVSFITPPGFIASPSNIGADDTKDSDPISGTVNGITLISGQTNNTIDAGFYQTASIGDFVWNDLNGNGIQDANEPGIAGVTVTLSTGATTVTNANGEYSFINLVPGTYSVTFTTPAGFIASPSNAGADDTKDSDPISGVVTNVTVLPGTANLTIDAGFQSTQLNLGNLVWYDVNNNGIQDAGEPGINGVSVKLFADANADNIPDGAALQTTATNASGAYGFSGLTPGKYIVGITAPSGYAMGFTTLTSLLPDNNDNTDNNGITIIGIDITSNFITLTTTGEPTADGDGNNGNLTLDFGLRGTGSIGDFVWSDLNANGIQDANEPGLAGVTVTLTYPAGNTSTVVTDANGAYTFNNLIPGNYSVGLSTPVGYNPSVSNAGSDDTKDSDPVNGIVSGINLSASQTNLTIDAGFYQYAALGDFVWSDLNANGIQDANEPGINNVTVNLLNAAGTVIGTTTTNASGAYSFTNLVPGTYGVKFTTPSGYIATGSNAGGDDTKDSDPVSGTVSSIVLASGETNNTIDAGFIQQVPIILSGNVFYDSDGMSDGFVNGTTTIPSGINAILYDPVTNTVLAVQPVPGYLQPGAGTFSFNVLGYSSYRVMISTANPAIGSQAPATSVLPTSFKSTGEIIGTGPGNDGLVDGKSIIINTTNLNITNVNFAIKRVVLIVVD